MKTKISAILGFILVSVIVGLKSLESNIYADDAGFISNFNSGNFSSWIQDFRNYVPGRNLHIFWQYLFFEMLDMNQNQNQMF